MHPPIASLLPLVVGFCLASCTTKRQYDPVPDGSTGGSSGNTSNPEGGAGGMDSSTDPITGPCANHDCQNGATCEEAGEDDYACVCPDGFEGDRCETDIDECAADPCENGGNCSDGIGDYECTCPAEWAGKNCELPRFELLPEGFTPVKLNANGTIVIGGTNYGASNARAARYTGGQLRDLGVYSGDSNSEALALSADGETIVGSSGFSAGELQGRRAIRWRGTSMTQLPKLNDEDLCSATGVTADGQVIVGTCDSRVVRWTTDGIEDLGVAPSTMTCSKALVNADGSLLMATCSQSGDNKVFLHTSEGFTMLASQPHNCRLQDIAPDGSAAVAHCGSANGYSSFAWTPTAGVVPSDIRVTWSALTASGEITVGYFATSDYQQYGTRWNSNGEQEDIGDVLSDAGVDVGDVVSFQIVLDVSDDGKTYLGQGKLDTNETVHWVARL